MDKSQRSTPNTSHPVVHYGSLAVILLLGVGLRFLYLAAKPLWLDEIITALFSLGRSYTEVPLDQVFAPSQLIQLFTYQPGQNCAAIADRVATESVHPPLFFCLSYAWMGWLSALKLPWVWALRALPALMGVGAIAALYGLNRVAFSATAGVVGAALMAVSPFAVYLSQEARHYTLPMVLITLSLMGLVQMQRDLHQQRLRVGVWLGWVVMQGLGLYTHYLVVLAIAAQVGALALWMGLKPVRPRDWAALGLAIGAIALLYLPWLPTFWSHLTRPETDWLRPYDPEWLDYLAPIAQTLANWAVMVVALPVEGQPGAIAIAAAVLMGLACLWLGRIVVRGWRVGWDRHQRPSFMLLGSFVAIALLEFFVIIYGLGKDISVVPRYNFVYYPGVCALLAACLTEEKQSGGSLKWRPVPWLSRSLGIVLGLGIISSLFVGYGWVFQKAYYPDRVARTIYADASLPVILVVSYRSLQEVALGLSFAVELNRIAKDTPIEIAFINSQQGDRQVWKAIPRLQHSLPLPLHLWIVANSSVRKRDFPNQLRLFNPAQPTARGRGECQLDPEQTHRLGFPYQGYRCDLQSTSN
ncbi:MAG: hypothetical protein HC881_22840 [Leptolyngbyaceae cyanobacterium SL_7_1]|nr:hypothetical protein [Leptolyngbyaceae cyanobacterium SL_7_1]